MPAPLASLEARVDTSVAARLANATATHTPAGGSASAAVDVIYRLGADMLDDVGIVAQNPEVVVHQSVWPTAREGDAVAIGGGIGIGGYLVRVVEPLRNGGLKRLVLARTS